MKKAVGSAHHLNGGTSTFSGDNHDGWIHSRVLYAYFLFHLL